MWQCVRVQCPPPSLSPPPPSPSSSLPFLSPAPPSSDPPPSSRQQHLASVLGLSSSAYGQSSLLATRTPSHRPSPAPTNTSLLSTSMQPMTQAEASETLPLADTQDADAPLR